jgi:hypothetical protein
VLLAAFYFGRQTRASVPYEVWIIAILLACFAHPGLLILFCVFLIAHSSARTYYPHFEIKSTIFHNLPLVAQRGTIDGATARVRTDPSRWDTKERVVARQDLRVNGAVPVIPASHGYNLYAAVRNRNVHFYVSVDAQSNLDSGDIDSETVTVDVDNIRYEDGAGVVTTDVDTGDINDMNFTVAFVSFSASADTELKISTNNTPAAGFVKVDSTDDTDNVVLLKGKLKLEGDSDAWLDSLPFTLVSTGGSTTAITGSVTLVLGSEEFTESTGSNCVDEADFTTAVSCDTAGATDGLLFDNLDYDIAAGSTVNFTLKADINDLQDGAAAVDFDAGDSLTASITTAGRAFIDVENEEGDQLTDSTEVSGNALGETQTFYENGVNVTMGTTTYASVTDGGDVTQVTYTIPLSVTSFGDTRYTGLSAEYEANAGAVDDDLALAFELQDSTAPSSGLENGTVSSTFTCDSTLEASTGYRLDENELVHCTLQVIHTTPGTASRSYRVQVNEFQTYSDAALNTDELIQTLTPIQDFQTGYQFITG